MCNQWVLKATQTKHYMFEIISISAVNLLQSIVGSV